MKARRLQHCPDPTYSKMRKVLCFQDKTQFKSFFYIYTNSFSLHFHKPKSSCDDSAAQGQEKVNKNYFRGLTGLMRVTLNLYKTVF